MPVSRRTVASPPPLRVFRLMERYYVKVKGTLGCIVAHDSLADAYAEARRLFDLNERSRRVYVLQVMGTLEPEVTPKKGRRQPPTIGRITTGVVGELGRTGLRRAASVGEG